MSACSGRAAPLERVHEPRLLVASWQVLSTQAAVLRELFVGQRDAAGAGEVGSRHGGRPAAPPLCMPGLCGYLGCALLDGVPPTNAQACSSILRARRHTQLLAPALPCRPRWT